MPRDLTNKEILSVDIDIQRQRAEEADRNQRLDDMKKSKRFAAINEVPWKQTLAMKMAYFAASYDESFDEWPFDRFAGGLEEAGLQLPEGMTIEAAVQTVLNDFEAGNPKWYWRNIVTPLEQRFNAGFAQASLDSGSKEIKVWFSGRPAGTSHLELVLLAAELRLAQSKLAARARSRGRRADAVADQEEAARFRYLADVDDAAARLVDGLMPDVGVNDQTTLLLTMDDLLGEDPQGDPRSYFPATNLLLNDVARMVNEPLLESDRGAQFCNDIAAALRKQALDIAFTKKKEKHRVDAR